MNRREFIKGLMAAAVVSQVPMSFETAEHLADALPPGLFVNGQVPTGVTDVGNGWFRMWWDMSSPDFLHINTRLDDKAMLDMTTSKVKSGEPVTFSLYAKDAPSSLGPDGAPTSKNIWGAQLETHPKEVWT